MADASNSDSSMENQIKIQKLEETLSTRTAELEKYKSLLDKAVPKLKEIKAELDVKTSALTEKTDECHALKAKVEELSSTHASSSSDELASRLANAEQKLVESQEQFKGKMNKAVEKLKEMKADVDQKSARIQELESLLLEKSTSNAAKDDDLSRENAKLLSTLHDLESVLAHHKQEAQSKQDELNLRISELQGQLVESKAIEKNITQSLGKRTLVNS
jgi:chromosome segregation ATPase